MEARELRSLHPVGLRTSMRGIYREGEGCSDSVLRYREGGVFWVSLQDGMLACRVRRRHLFAILNY